MSGACVPSQSRILIDAIIRRFPMVLLSLISTVAGFLTYRNHRSIGEFKKELDEGCGIRITTAADHAMFARLLGCVLVVAGVAGLVLGLN